MIEGTEEVFWFMSKREEKIITESRVKDNYPIELANNHGYGNLAGD